MKTSNPTTIAARRYLMQFGAAMIAYVVVLFATMRVLDYFHPAGVLRYIALAPLVPIAFLIPVVSRYLSDTDELERRIATEATAIGGAVTAILSVTYAFLENTGFPHLSAWWTWSVVMGATLVARLALNRRYG
jgi:hypothetical protein